MAEPIAETPSLAAIKTAFPGMESTMAETLSTLKFDPDLRVRHFTPPPQGFDPKTADQRMLLVHGFPARPDPVSDLVLRNRWDRVVSKARVRVEPEFKRTNKKHGPLVRTPQMANATSSNWSGSVVFAASGDSFNWVAGQWTVPDPNAPSGASGSYYSSSWVGIDGWGSGDVLQAGTESEIINGNKNVYLWWEWYPDYEVQITNLGVSAGDTIYCLICAWSTTSAGVYLTNVSTGGHASFSITPPSGTTLVGNSAEWIVEAPTVGGGLTALTDYGVCYFDEATSHSKNGVNFNGGTGATPITMVNSGGTALSTPVLEATQLLKVRFGS